MVLQKIRSVAKDYGYSVGVMAIFACLSGAVAWRTAAWHRAEAVKEVRRDTETRLIVYANALAASLGRRTTVVGALRTLVETSREAEGTFGQFAVAAATFSGSVAGVRVLGLAPDGVTAAVYPRAGNEVVVGNNILGDPRPEVGRAAADAVRTRRIITSDPYELRQGGTGFFQRAAVYRNGQLWGLVFLGSDVKTVLSDAGIAEDDPGLLLALRDSRQRVFFGSPAVFDAAPATAVVSVPGIRWELAAVPRAGWQALDDSHNYFPLLAALVWLLVNVLGAVLWFQRQALILMVRRRTGELEQQAAELSESEQKYRALLHQATDPIILCEYGADVIIEANPAFQRYFGYSDSEIRAMNLHDLLLGDAGLGGGTMPLGFAAFRGKDGKIVVAEMLETAIENAGRKYRQIVFRRPSRERTLEGTIRAEVTTAGQIQRSMLPADVDEAGVTVRTFFAPATIVSGDFFDYRWSADEQILSGYVLDVSGHGIATAVLTATVSAMLTEELRSRRRWTTVFLEKLNLQMLELAPAEYFAAVMLFTLDLRKRRLDCYAGGINHFLASSGAECGWVTLPGSFLGVSAAADFSTRTFPIQHGDVFCFPTDGISELLRGPKRVIPVGAHDFSVVVGLLDRLTSTAGTDDQSAVCVRISGLPAYPQFFAIGRDSFPRFKPRLSGLLGEMAGDARERLEPALYAAIAAALTAGGMVCLKVNRFGRRLTLRLRAPGAGEAGEAAMAAVVEGMRAVADRVLVSRANDEALFMKKTSI